MHTNCVNFFRRDQYFAHNPTLGDSIFDAHVNIITSPFLIEPIQAQLIFGVYQEIFQIELN